MYKILFSAIGLVFVFEGLLPFLAPTIWRRAMTQLLVQNNRGLRIFGLISMLIGLLIVYLTR